MNRVAEQVQRVAELAKRRNSQDLQGTSGAFLPEKISCRDCKDTGWVAVLEDETTCSIAEVAPGIVFHARECLCSEKKRRMRALKSSRITEEFQKLGFQSFITEGRPQAVKLAYGTAMEYFHRFDEICTERCNSMALLGKPGCGKTHLLMAVSNNLMRKGHELLYFPWVEGMNELRDDLSELENKTNVMRNIEILYIDDLFKGRKEPTEWALEQLFGIVNYRYLNHKPTLFSSEKSIDAICEIDEGVGSRLFEMARNYTVQLSLTPEERLAKVKLNYRLR